MVYELQLGTADRLVLLRLWSCQLVTLGELLVITILCIKMYSDSKTEVGVGEGNVSNNTKNLLWKSWATHIPVVSPAKRQLAKEKYSRPVILL